MKILTILTVVFGLAFSLNGVADDRVDHYKGKPAKTLKQAFANLKEYNAQLEALVEKDKLTPEEMNEVHQITYTLENALQKIAAEHGKMAEVLEEVHLASESADPGTVKKSGRDYLKRTQQLIP